MTPVAKKNKRARSGIISTVILCLAVALCLVVSVQVSTRGYVRFFGYSMFRVVTGSMEPTLPVGSILLCKTEGIESIHVDDIVCFRSRESGRLGQVVTHRVLNVLESDGGTTFLETKGDANLSPDGYLVSQDNLIGRVVWHTGEGSRLKSTLSFVTGKVGFLACIVFPILLLSGLILRDNVKSIRKEMKEAMDELIRESASKNETKLIGGVFTPEEYQEMYDRIRAELMEELRQNEANQTSVPEQGQDEE